MGREAWRAVVHGVAESRTRLSNWIELNWTDVVSSQLVLAVTMIYFPQSMKHSSSPGPWILINTFAPGSRHWEFLPATEHDQRVPTVPPWRAGSWPCLPSIKLAVSRSATDVPVPGFAGGASCTSCHYILAPVPQTERLELSELMQLVPREPSKTTEKPNSAVSPAGFQSMLYTIARLNFSLLFF